MRLQQIGYILYLLINSIVIYLFYVLQPSWGDTVSFILFSLTLIYFLLSLYKFNPNRNQKIVWLTPSNFLLLGLIIVNLQTLLNVYFNYGTLDFYLEAASNESMKDTVLYFSIIGFNFYFIGLESFKFDINKGHRNRKLTTISLWGYLTAIVFIYFLMNIDLISFMTGMTYRGSGAYDRIREDSEFAENLLNVFFTIYISIYAYNHFLDKRTVNFKAFIKEIPLIFWIPFLLYVLLRALSGDRGPVIYNILLLFFAYFMVVQPKIKLLYVLSGLFFGASLVTIMGIARGLATDKSVGAKFSEAIEMSSDSKPSIFPATQELGNSINCNFIAVTDIEEEKTHYRYGANTLFNIISAVPGTYSITRKMLDIDPVQFSTSEYLTVSLFGAQYRFGLGMSAFSEFYLDGGLLGIVCGFFFLGVLYKFVDTVVLNPSRYSIYVIIFVLKLASICVYLPRSSMGYGIGKALYGVIIYYILNHLFILFIRRKNGNIIYYTD
ncbi:MAG: oligosaccharide repeat unit polymerase [Clostridia bacterium]|nr:oligosaccharide repeat unit polymerase [Clostridia bacterium]